MQYNPKQDNYTLTKHNYYNLLEIATLVAQLKHLKSYSSEIRQKTIDKINALLIEVIQC